MLAGHSHGGQVRIPFYGPIIVPYAVDEYDLGLFQTKSGPLYVTSGIGWYPVPIRFNCRPEITVDRNLKMPLVALEFTLQRVRQAKA